MNTDQIVRDGLDKLADAVHTTQPPLHELLNRPPRMTTRRRQRRTLVAAGIGGVIAIVGATAVAAAVLIPDRVANQLDGPSQRQSGVTIQIDKAEQRATYTTSDGTIYELWVAPEVGGDTCRTVTSSSEPLDSDQWAAVCVPRPFGTTADHIGAYEMFVIGDHVAISGSAPGATTVALDLSGVTLTAPVSNGEYFAVRDAPCTLEQRTECLSNIKITTQDAAGRPIETIGD
jgi:hypothetical protein